MPSKHHLKFPHLKSDLGLAEHKQFLMAAMRSDKKQLEIFLNKGVNVNYANTHGETALYLVSGTGSLDCARMLVGYGADCTLITKSQQTVLHNAACSGNEKLLEYYRGLGLDQIDFESWGGSTGLILAARRNHSKAIFFLLQHGADINYRDKNGLSALQYTVRNGNFESLNLLCYHGANLNLKSIMDGAKGECPLHCAMREKLTRAISILLQYGAKISCCSTCKRGKPCSRVPMEIFQRVRDKIELRKKSKNLTVKFGTSLKEEKQSNPDNNAKSLLYKIFRRKKERKN